MHMYEKEYVCVCKRAKMASKVWWLLLLDMGAVV